MLYPEGSFGAQAGGRRLRILDAYVEARQAAEEGRIVGAEAMSTSDFPTYIGSFLRHSFLERYREVSGAWRQYSRGISVRDFEAYTASRFGRFPDIPEKPLNGPYEELAIRELPGPTIRLREFGAVFGLTRQLIIADRLDEIRRLPTQFAEAMARTESKSAVEILETNPTMWDGVQLFHTNHGNVGNTPLTPDYAGAAALMAADDAIDNQTDPEGYKVVPPGGRKTIIYPRALRWVVNVLLTSPTLPVDVNDPVSGLLPNPVQNLYDTIEEPFLTDNNDWYMVADASGQLGFLAHVTLNGNQQPFLGVRDREVRAILGGNEPYTFDFDELYYKIRHDWNFVPYEHRGVFKSVVAGG